MKDDEISREVVELVANQWLDTLPVGYINDDGDWVIIKPQDLFATLMFVAALPPVTALDRRLLQWYNDLSRDEFAGLLRAIIDRIESLEPGVTACLVPQIFSPSLIRAVGEKDDFR